MDNLCVRLNLQSWIRDETEVSDIIYLSVTIVVYLIVLYCIVVDSKVRPGLISLDGRKRQQYKQNRKSWTVASFIQSPPSQNEVGWCCTWNFPGWRWAPGPTRAGDIKGQHNYFWGLFNIFSCLLSFMQHSSSSQGLTTSFPQTPGQAQWRILALGFCIAWLIKPPQQHGGWESGLWGGAATPRLGLFLQDKILEQLL